MPLIGRKGFQLSKDWNITINGNVENVYVNVTFQNVTIYNKSGGGVLGSSKAQVKSLEDRVEEGKKAVAVAPEPTLEEIATQLGRRLKGGVNGNMTKSEFTADGTALDQAFEDVISNPTNPNQTIAEWFDTLSERGGGIRKFVSYLRDDCGLDSVKSSEVVTDEIKAALQGFLSP